MPTTLFSTYSGGENRITATILAVLRSLSLDRIERLLGALIGEEEFGLVHFENQAGRGGLGVPDAELSSSCRILIETKKDRNAVNRAQLERHLQRLESTTEALRYCLVLTPDEIPPAEVLDFRDKRLIWTNFAVLDQAIDGLLADKVISEREAFLLCELQIMLREEGLLCFEKDTVIVAARSAWDEYQKHQIYICQPGRAFQQVQYMGFYKDNKILELVPRILDHRDHVRMERGFNKGELGRAVDQRLSDPTLPKPFSEQQVFLLSGKDDRLTTHLAGPISNDLLSASGRPTAFTQGQRYVSLESLLHAKRTSEIDEAERGGARGHTRTKKSSIKGAVERG